MASGNPGMAAVQRRNSRVEITPGSGWVRKTYHATYTAAEELEAYGRLGPVAARVPGVRTATARSAGAALEIEYVAGSTLAAALVAGRAAGSAVERAVALAAEADRAGLVFDADPSNLILAGDDLVIIDPVMRSVAMRHTCGVILLFGLAKACARGLARPWRLPQLLVQWRTAWVRYRSDMKVDGAALRQDFATYLLQVARWNRERSAGEPSWIHWARRVTLAPAYSLAGRMLRSLAR